MPRWGRLEEVRRCGGSGEEWNQMLDFRHQATSAWRGRPGSWTHKYGDKAKSGPEM